MLSIDNIASRSQPPGLVQDSYFQKVACRPILDKSSPRSNHSTLRQRSYAAHMFVNAPYVVRQREIDGSERSSNQRGAILMAKLPNPLYSNMLLRRQFATATALCTVSKIGMAIPIQTSEPSGSPTEEIKTQSRQRCLLCCFQRDRQ